MSTLWAIALLGILAVPLPQQVPAGKAKTDRSIHLQVVVDGTPDELFDLWTSAAGCNMFFGVESNIELRRGGPYEIYFMPRSEPDSDANSSKGATVIDYQAGRFLSFEWTFPPMARPLHSLPLPMWIEVRFAPLDGVEARTSIDLRHEGFGRGPLWDQVYEFYVTGWSDILYRLQGVQARAASGRP